MTPGQLLEDPSAIRARAKAAKRIAVLGIKPGSRGGQPAHYVPARVQAQGATIVPVPVYYPDVETILGEPVVRDLRAVGEVDMVNVFRRADDLAQHLEDLLALAPPLVWLQSGIRDDAFAARLTAAGIDVVQSRCLMVERG
ncbi:MAG TPA: CoA-binding protein [Polyangiaceae bacterium LLY-WYZ-15_(1-7)]|nr:CoA-binding protein [Myxococcales bacterium]MAT24797.1 CoA-binding protein [Sandaracinus sp.]HJK89450.1 CoA-binding protein [Polyangiaceae bacterium LLY-WYZ-15_(1-7)]HJL02422.1 CoA-binding protein [Polyangiaceae bacterium LLY-WYZ-15_(1-7)]HJL11712.1 CoA-binding protein [Polyangiaceae bacterium LLY-WYZ-15_(1-7)]